MSATVEAAGTAVVRFDRKKPLVAIIHRPDYDDWSLPKGKLDPGESFRDAARRETIEEIGLAVVLGAPLPSVTYTDHKGREKTVQYWVATPLTPPDGTVVDGREVDEVRWLTFDDASELVTHDHDREILASARKRATPPILLVRHAHAGDRKRWDGPDHKRPISERGQAESWGLVDVLAPFRVTALLTSPLNRCKQTLKPVAAERDLKVKTDKRLAEGSTTPRVRKLLRDVEGEGVVLCTHGDIIAGLMTWLDEQDVPLDDPLQWQKGSTWVLPTWKGRVVGGAYLPPLR